MKKTIEQRAAGEAVASLDTLGIKVGNFFLTFCLFGKGFEEVFFVFFCDRF